MAIDRKAWRPRIEHPPLRLMYLSGPALREGVEEQDVDGVTVRVFSAAKTVADCFKFRNKIGTDVAVEALRDYPSHEPGAGACKRRRVGPRAPAESLPPAESGVPAGAVFKGAPLTQAVAAELADALQRFLGPVLAAAARGEMLSATWPPGGPWKAAS